MDKIPMLPLTSRPVPRSGLAPLPRSLLQLIIKRANAVESVIPIVVHA